jgi:catechol-2,3-dioxygenase
MGGTATGRHVVSAEGDRELGRRSSNAVSVVGRRAVGEAVLPVIERLGHVGLHVNDLDVQVAFYRDLLGLEVTDRDPGMGLAFLSSHPEMEHHELVLMAGRTAAPDALLVQQVSFRCVNLQALLDFYARLVEHAVRIDMTVTHGNALSVYFFDPEGNRVEVYWPTELPARQPFVVGVDLTREPDELLAEVEQLVAQHGATGVVQAL